MEDPTRHIESLQAATGLEVDPPPEIYVADWPYEDWVAPPPMRAWCPVRRPAREPDPDIVKELLAPVASILARIDQRRVEEAQRGLKALALASNIHIYAALMRGERVPWNVLNYWEAERFGLRRRNPDGRYGLDDFNDVRRPMSVS